jgi:lipopolysaccharide/colanic/teichoic acid biosynthesis glycosyltransferase
VIKRLFDFVAAGAGLLILLPVFAVVAILIKLDSPGPVFFRQQRIGRRFRPFFIYKFRTMVKDAPQRGGAITFDRDARVTRLGSLLRNSNIDELPQLFNVLRGDMSLVGPRPEVKEYVELFRQHYEVILGVRPGMTDPASVMYRHEAEILSQTEDPEKLYRERVLPEKLRLGLEYINRRSFWHDVGLILRTLGAITLQKEK